MAPRTLSRRILLQDLGRLALGAVVVGGVAGCGDGTADEAAGGADATTSTSPTDSATPSTPTSDTATPSDGDAPASGGDVAWERASYGFVSAYVLVRDGEALVFDTGTGDGGVEPLTAALEAAGVGWGDVGTVLVSHEHGDHIGGVGAVMEQATAATALAAEPDLAALRDRVDGAQAVADGDALLGGARVVATPGHTAGHVSLFEAASGVLLTGDAVVNGVEVGGTSGDGIEVSPPQFTADEAAALRSVQVLADLGPTTMLFGHGEPLTEDAASLLRDYAATL